jgi:hypothetical protein
MPSDRRVSRVFELLASGHGQYRNVLATTLEEIRGQLEAGRSDELGRAHRLQEQFGQFAGGRIDAGRLSQMLGNRSSLDVSALRRLERASDVLRNLLSRGDGLFHVATAENTDPAQALGQQLGVIGRGFAAARIARAAQAGASSGLDEDRALESFPFGDWNSAERRLAPAVVVSTAGVDLVAGAFAPFLDGSLKIVLIVDGLCPPAPLVRLITPATFVMQAHEIPELEALVSSPGVGIGALMPIWAVRFAHDPAGGPESWQRTSVHITRTWRIKRVGPFTPDQQEEELRQLQVLAAAPAPIADAPRSSETSPVDPAERLATWLLNQAQLTGAATAE